MNFFKLYIGDYQRDTAHLSMAEHGAFLLMLQTFYATEKPLPKQKHLHRMLRAQNRAEREAIDSVVKQFWVETEHGLVNLRAEVEIKKAALQADTNRAIAQAREARKKGQRNDDETSTNRSTNDQPNQTPDTRHQTVKPPLPPTGGTVHEFPPGFDRFWSAYPRKTAKPQAAKAFARLKPDEALLDRMLAALAVHRQLDQWTRDKGQFIPHPSTWLNGRRWEDEVGTPAVADAFAGAL